MSKNSIDIENLKTVLGKLSGVKSAGEIEVAGDIIQRITIDKESLGKLTIQRLAAEDAPALFDFYFQGLSEKSRSAYDPYPLFQPPVSSAEELAARIEDWKKEDDWSVLDIIKDGKIIGMGILKKFKKEKPVFGFAIREEYQGKGLGTILLTIVNEQAKMLGLRKLWSATQEDNKASLAVHAKCGFKLTGVKNPHYIFKDGKKELDRYDVEMLEEFHY